MPTSQPEHLTPICQKILQLAPEVNSALDIGVGIGKWGVLLREYLEVFPHWRFYQDTWKVRLEGIEIHEKYRNPVWQVYNEVHVGNALDLLQSNESRYDLTVMVDVLEHFTQPDGIKLLETLYQKSKYTIFSYHNCEQNNVEQNSFENHISKWRDLDFNNCEKIIGEKDIWGTFLLRGKV